MKHRAIFICIAQLYLLSCFPGPGIAGVSHPVVVTGTVQWSDTRAPAAGVTVSVYSVNGDTSAPLGVTQSLVNGSFVLRVPSPGDYQFVASVSQDSAAVDEPITVPAGGSRITLLLSERFRRSTSHARPIGRLKVAPAMRLDVADAAGKPVNRGTVQVWVVWAPHRPEPLEPEVNWYATGIWSQFEAGRGVMEINPLHFFYRQFPARVGIAVRSALYGTAQIFLDRWPETPVKIRLRPAPGLTGMVVDQDGKPASGVDVRVTGMAPEFPFRFLQGWAWASTGKTGKFDIPALFPGRYVVRVRKPFGKVGPVRNVNIPHAGIRGLVNLGAANKLSAVRSNSSQASLHAPSITLRLPTQGLSTLNSLYAFGIFGPQPALEETEQDPGVGSGAGVTRVAYFGEDTMDPQPEVAPIRIRGRLKVAATGTPVSNCAIELYRGGEIYPANVTTTQSDGSFSMSVPGPGYYRLVADQDKYLPCDNPIMLAKTRTAPFTLIVSPRPAAEVLVLGPDGQPVKGVPITIWITTFHGSSINVIPSVKVEPIALKWRILAAPPPGEWRVFGARSDTLGVGVAQMDHWPTTPVIVRLAPGVTLHCHVLDAAGKPVFQAMIRPMRRYGSDVDQWDNASVTSDQETDVNGNAQFKELLPGLYQIQVSGPQLPSFTTRVTLTAPDTTITLKPDPPPTGH